MKGVWQNRFQFICWCSLFNVLHAIDVKTANRAYQNVIDTASFVSQHSAISLGVALPHETASFAAGYKNRKSGTKLEPQDKMPVGSATKSITAAAVLNLVDQGKVGLDDPALPHMDVLIRKMTRKSLVQYLGPDIRNVTVRHLLHMTSGIGDIDSKNSRLKMMSAHGVGPVQGFDFDKDFGEQMASAAEEREFLQGKSSSSKWTCKPGQCGDYSSTNYLLLGMMLAQVNGADHWSDYDQSSFLPVDVRQKMRSTVFPLKGHLGDFTDVETWQPKPAGPGDWKTFPANSGFTVGNAISNGADMGTFLRALLGKDQKILNPGSRKEMLKLRWLETGYGNKVSNGQFYGMGVRDLSGQLVLNPVQLLANPELSFAGLLFGHDGASLVGYSSFNAYAPKYDTAMSFIMNDNKAMPFYNFIARKTYDLTSGLTPLVESPLQAEYENKNAFMRAIQQ